MKLLATIALLILVTGLAGDASATVLSSESMEVNRTFMTLHYNVNLTVTNDDATKNDYVVEVQSSIFIAPKKVEFKLDYDKTKQLKFAARAEQRDTNWTAVITFTVTTSNGTDGSITTEIFIERCENRTATATITKSYPPLPEVLKKTAITLAMIITLLILIRTLLYIPTFLKNRKYEKINVINSKLQHDMILFANLHNKPGIFTWATDNDFIYNKKLDHWVIPSLSALDTLIELWPSVE